jgi:hypothetical protein
MSGKHLFKLIKLFNVFTNSLVLISRLVVKLLLGRGLEPRLRLKDRLERFEFFQG